MVLLAASVAGDHEHQMVPAAAAWRHETWVSWHRHGVWPEDSSLQEGQEEGEGWKGGRGKLRHLRSLLLLFL
jgi:hypothetical protein